MLNKKKSKKSNIMPREVASDYQHRLIHNINERDKARHEAHKEMELANQALNKANGMEQHSESQIHEHKVYDHHHANVKNLRIKIENAEELIEKLSATLDKRGYEVNKNTGRITPKHIVN